MAQHDSIIQVYNLSKKYLVGHETARHAPYRSLRETLVRKARNFGRKTVDMARGRRLLHGDEVEEFWALKNVSFEVARGEVVGIVGGNGAGKSTLLKILSRITEPTEGQIRIDGRVASLLEVGTGFHPELTGRENIFLNGAILGMRKGEIKEKFDEIVAFAEVERFLDTPVKHYSSGMYVRLAFAVAAHLEPDILVVDEVLAVGDAAFQKKCLGKMREVSGQHGRTVLFVSHNMAAIEALCSRALLLDSGQLGRDGLAFEVVKDHLQNMMNGTAFVLRDGQTRFIKCLKMTDKDGTPTTAFQIGDSVSFDIELFSPELVEQPRLGISIHTPSGERIVTLHTHIQQTQDWSFSGRMRLRAVWNNIPLNTGEYRVDVSLWACNNELETLTGCTSLNVCAKDVYGTGRLPDPSFQGYLVPDGHWELRSVIFSKETVSPSCSKGTNETGLIG
jgi:lipopolysaccharide transport system ATP-binding protein